MYYDNMAIQFLRTPTQYVIKHVMNSYIIMLLCNMIMYYYNMAI